MEYTTTINREAKEIWIKGKTQNDNHFMFLVTIENGSIKYIGYNPLDLYNKKIFTGGEWKYFEKQEAIFKYILN